MVPRPRNGLSLCAGAGGLDMGLMLAEPDFHTRCFVEWEEYPRSAIIAAQNAGYFAPAPIWDDVTTFDGRPLRGAIDTILAGYPCQPFSQAGQRKGENDERHLWPDIARIIDEVCPAWVILENVEGHVSLGAETVLRDLQELGFVPAASLFTASETGAPHQRKRWFCVAYSDSNAQQFTGRRGIPKPDGRDNVGARGGWCGPARSGPDMADTGTAGLQGQRQAFSDQKRRQEPVEPTGLRGGTGVYPPGPSDAGAWGSILTTTPHLAPAISRGSIAKAAQAFAANLYALNPQGRGGHAEGAQQAQDLAREAHEMVGYAQAESAVCRMADGLALRSRALKLLGNGVVPLEAGYAIRTLSIAHGLLPVDLAAGG